MDRPTAVLIVEDHAALSEALTARLDREHDLRVVGTTSSPTHIVSMVDARRPDVVLLDVELGDQSGLDMIPLIRARPAEPKVVVLTCRADTETAVSAFRGGAAAFVPKVAPMEDLLAAIRTAAGGELWVSPAVLSRMLPEVLPATGATAVKDPLPLLTDREREVLSLMVEGLANAAIAKRLHLSIHTVRTHAHNVQTKLNVHSKLAAVAVAHRSGIGLA